MSPSKPDLKSPSYEGSVSSRSSRLSRAVGGLLFLESPEQVRLVQSDYRAGGRTGCSSCYVQPDTAQGSRYSCACDRILHRRVDTPQEEPEVTYVSPDTTPPEER